MPIPTRSGSVREPRKQPASIGRTTAIKPVSATTTATAADEPPSTASTAPTTDNNNTSNRNRTLLPRYDGRPPGTQLLQRSSKTSQNNGQPKQQQEQQSMQAPSTLLSQRQSLVRPSQLRTPSTLKPSTVATTTTSKRPVTGRNPPSPVKKESSASNTSKQNGRPTSPKKTDMPPSPRPTRSASLRQPASSSAGTLTGRGHVRHRSQIVLPASSHEAKKADPAQAPPTPTTPRLRTNFTTYQQNYSPKKTAKPPTPVPPAGASTDPGSSLIPSSWPEIAALQTELLQLSLLHKSRCQKNVAWETNAESQLQNRYNSVAEDYKAALDSERKSQRRLNGEALRCWLKNAREHIGQGGFAEQIQLLSQVTQEVYDLSNSQSGRYTAVIIEFEDWLQRVEQVKRSREGWLDPVLFIDPLGRNWKEEVNGMSLKLELLSRQLQSLDILGYGEIEAVKHSALCRTATGLEEMVKLMIEELVAIRKIEADVVKSEETWVSQLAQQSIEVQPQEEAVPRIGMWRQLSLKS